MIHFILYLVFIAYLFIIHNTLIGEINKCIKAISGFGKKDEDEKPTKQEIKAFFYLLLLTLLVFALPWIVVGFMIGRVN